MPVPQRPAPTGPTISDQQQAASRVRRAAARLWGSTAGRGGLVFALANVGVSLSNFVFHLVLSRLLGPAAYGALGALLNLTAVVGVPLAAVQVVVAQSVARLPNPDDTPPLGRLLRLSALGSGVGMALWLGATPTIDRFFHLHSPGATIALGLWLMVALPSASLEGVLIGQRRFRVVGIGQLVGGGLVRLASGVVLVSLGSGVDGGVVATLVAAAVTFAMYAGALRPALGRGGRFVPRPGEALLSTVAMGGVALLMAVDAWLARHFMPARAAGLFAAAATAGRIALFLPGAVTLVYFPRLAATRGRGAEARQALARATGLVTLLGLAAAAVMAAFPTLLASALFGATFAHAGAAIGTVAVADAGIGVAGCLIYYQVARGSRLALAGWPACVLAGVLAAAFHGSIEVLALDMLAASGTLVVGLGVPTVLQVLHSLADDAASLPRQAMLLDEPDLDLTVVVPFRNVGAERLAGHLVRICETLARSEVAFEVIPVSDGSTDDSERAFARLPAHAVRPIVLADNHGKGEALRIGLAVGRGRYLGFIDGDGDISAEGLASFVDLVRRDQPEVVVGSKRHRDALVNYPPLRRLYSTGYQLLTAALFGLRVRDTQTGIKLIRRDVVAEVLPRMVEKRFAFDLELLAVAHRLGYRQVTELPVTIGDRFPSTISPRAVWRMLQDTLAVFWRLRALRFYDPPLLDPTGDVVDPATIDARLAAKAPLRILVCNWRDLAHPQAGGAEVYTHRVTEAWAAAGHRVTIFCAAVAGQPSRQVVDGVTVVRRGGRHGVYRQARLFWERMGRGRFDLVVDEVNTRPFGAVRWARETATVALVHQLAREVWFHELWWPVAAVGRFLLEPRWLRQLRSVPVLTVSDSSSRSLARSGVEDVTVIPEGIDPVAVPAVEREPVPTVAFVGRLSPNKRPDHAVDAFRRAQAVVPGLQMWVMGTGPMEQQLRREAPEGVVLLGRVPEEEKRRRLARAHCLVATSAREGWGLAITEAAQVGTPAIAYDVDGLRDSVTASGGHLVPPHPTALADALAELLPAYVADGPPAVVAGGVVPWPEVADRLLAAAAQRVEDRRRASAGEDVRVAWRRAMDPIAAVCDRRAWSVAAIAALVALGPLSEGGYSLGVAWAAGIAVACLAVAVVGTVAEAIRHPAGWVAAGQADEAGTSGGSGSAMGRAEDAVGRLSTVRRGLRWHRGGLWIPVAVVGALSASLAQTWAGASQLTSGKVPAWLGAGWTHELVLGWSRHGRALGRPVAATADLPWAVLAGLVHALGGGTGLAQRLWLTVLFASVGVAAATLLWVLRLGVAACIAGGVAYGFSPYVLTMTGLDPAYLATMALVPAVAAFVLIAARRSRLGVWWLSTVPAAAVLGVAVSSPPMAVSVVVAGAFAILLAGWLGGRAHLRAALRRGAVAASMVAVAGLYWIVPYIRELATTSMVSNASTIRWGPTETRATLANGLWLNDAWNWMDARAFPFAGSFHRFPLVLWRYALPIGAVVALGVATSRAASDITQARIRLLAASGAVALAVVVLSTGPHLPGAPIFGLLTALPYGWLLQEPGRFLFVAGLAYAVMLALLVDQGRAGRPGTDKKVVSAAGSLATGSRGGRPVGWLAPAGVCVAVMFPTYPLVTGGIAAERSVAAPAQGAPTGAPAGLPASQDAERKVVP